MKCDILIYIILIVGCSSTTYEKCEEVQVLSHKPISKAEKYRVTLEVYVHKALPKHFSNAFTDVFLSISLKDRNLYKIYQGSNCSVVVNEYAQDNRLFGLLKSFNSWRATHLYPFNDTYIGIDTNQGYKISTYTWDVNYARVAFFLGGILLYLYAGDLVRNVLFYYTSGCTIGLLASVLLVAIIVYRIAPKKTIGIPILLGGWSFAAYTLHFLWNNFSFIVQQYQEYVIGYFAIALLISFAVCYKKGPPTDDRSHDIAQWTLQIIALALVYFSPQISNVAYATIAVLILHNFTKSWLWKFLKGLYNGLAWIWRLFFPSTRKLLTEEEYERQSSETTERELAKLRDYCRSPNANAWKITHSVKNRKRLARFIDGSEGHISDDEQIEHDLAARELDREDEDDDWEHEVIIRRRARNGEPSSYNSPEQSFLLPKGVKAEDIFQRISASAQNDTRRSRIPVNNRRSLGPGVLLPSSSSAKDRHLSKTSKQTVNKHKSKPNKSMAASRSLRTNDYFSSDSEEQTIYEEELLAQGGDFDFEND